MSLSKGTEGRGGGYTIVERRLRETFSDAEKKRKELHRRERLHGSFFPGKSRTREKKGRGAHLGEEDSAFNPKRPYCQEKGSRVYSLAKREASIRQEKKKKISIAQTLSLGKGEHIVLGDPGGERNKGEDNCGEERGRGERWLPYHFF